MKRIRAGLLPVVENINLPTVLKTAVLPGDSAERLFIATQVGEIYYTGDDYIETFLDIRSRILELGAFGGYDERGLVGLAFHPDFYYNGLFYLHYSAAGTQGPGALRSFSPDPCDTAALNLRWTDRETRYDHIDTVEEWILRSNNRPEKRRTLLNIRRPFSNHNGVNSLNFSPETGKLILTTGDGGLGYDPFNLSQDDMEIAGKIIEIDTDRNITGDDPPVVTRFDELPAAIQATLTVIAKGVRNIPGISFRKRDDQYIKLTGNVGQDLVEAVFSFTDYKPVPVDKIARSALTESDREGFINFGWRGWEGNLPTPVIRSCPSDPAADEMITAYYDEAVKTSAQRLIPLTCYYHKDPRPDKFMGTALTGVQPYMGYEIPDLNGCVVFTDLAGNEESPPPARGVLAYTHIKEGCGQNDYGIIETGYDFGSRASYYVSLGTNLDSTVLYLGVYGSMKVADYNQGTVFKITR